MPILFINPDSIVDVDTFIDSGAVTDIDEGIGY